jgi:Phage major capsid protein E
MAGVYNTSQLLEVSRFTKTLTPFWLSFFPRQINFDTEEIFFDKVDRDYRRLAPLVVPNVQGRLMTIGGYSSLSFKPAYVKPKHAVDPNMVIERQAGEALGSGSLSLEQRRNASIAEILRIHDTMLTNRNEWLAARALIDGSVTLSGEDYPTTTVNFQRHSSLSYALTGTARWSETTGTPLTDLMTARVNANNRSGARIQDIVMGGDAWGYFEARVPLKDLMDRNYGGLDANVQRMRDGYEGVEYMGSVSGSMGGGRLRFWVDTSKYVDETGTEQFFLNQKTAVGVSDVEGVRCFGAIKDFDAQLRPLERFPKMWRENDPSVEFLMTQSSPLMVPKKPNASFKILTTDS